MNTSNPGRTILESLIVIFGSLIVLALILAVSYGLIALVTWAICSCFGWPWSWTMALGIWFLSIFLKWMHKYITSHGENK